MLNNEQLCVVGLVISSRQSAHCSAVVYSAVAGKGGGQRPCAGGFEGVTVESFHSPACAQPGQVEFHKKGWPGLREREGGDRILVSKLTSCEA